jgi:branched-chain amino acid transport system ATP-binding protein
MAVLQVEKIDKRFGGLVAVEDFSMTVEENEIVGLIGPNGAGKTTAFNIMAGFYKADSGRVLFLGKDILGMRPYQISRLGLARTFQVTKPFTDLTVLENVMVGAFACIRNRREAQKRAWEVLEILEFHDRWDVLGGELTATDHKRLEMARALATEPKLLLLDEPMAGLNSTEKMQFLDLLRNIRNQGKALLLIEHDLKAVMSICGRITVMNRGKKLIEGTAEQVSNDPKAIAAYLGDEYVTSQNS